VYIPLSEPFACNEPINVIVVAEEPSEGISVKVILPSIMTVPVKGPDPDNPGPITTLPLIAC
jgi:hypothetical protein